jgi:hypothetical protein
VKFEARCTAVLSPGAITQRVDRVIRPRREAVDMIRTAQMNADYAAAEVAANLALTAVVARKPAPAARPRRRRSRPATARPPRAARGYKIVCVSFYDDDLAAIDEAVERLRAARHRRMSRSGLLRLAFSLLDVDQLAKAPAP